MWKDFKPTILFLLRFFGVYIFFSFLYGLYIQHYDTAAQPVTDPITRVITYQCTRTSSLMGYRAEIIENDHLNYESAEEQTYDSLWLNNQYAISIEEGCNGINLMILFMAFVVGFGGKTVNMLIFIPAGLVFIHLANLGRLMLLSLLNIEWGGQAFHFFHKYGFTAVIYVAIFLLWYLWVMRFSGKLGTKTSSHAASEKDD